MPENNKNNKRKITPGRILRSIGFAFVLFLFVVMIIAGFTQTGIFRETLRQIAISQADKYIDGKLYIEEIEGNLITGFKLREVRLEYEGKNVISAGLVDIRFNPVNLLRTGIYIENLVLIQPQFNLVKYEDGTLNLNRIIRTTEPKEKEADVKDKGEAPKWEIVLKNLEILDGSFHYVNLHAADNGYDDEEKSFPVINYDDLHIAKIYLTMSLSSDGENHAIDLRSLNFSIPGSRYAVSQLSLRADIAPDITKIGFIRLMAGHTHFTASGTIEGYNLISPADDATIEDALISLTLNSERIHFDDLKTFLPSLWFLEGESAISVSLYGTVQEMHVTRMRSRFGGSHLNISGRIYDILQPEVMVLDAVIEESSVNPGDVNALLPHFNIPYFSSTEKIELDGWFSGQPKNFSAGVQLNTVGGYYEGKVNFDFREELLAYSGVVSSREAYLTQIIDIAGPVPEDMTMNLSFEGRGTQLSDIVAEAALEIESAMLEGLELHNFTADVKANNYEIDAEVSGFLTGSHVNFHILTYLEDYRNAPFDIALSVESLNIADVTGDTLYDSDVTFDLVARGKGYTPETFLGDISIIFGQSRFRDHSFNGDSVNIRMKETDPLHREFNLESELADISISGTFDLQTVVDIASAHIQEIINTVGSDITQIIDANGEVASVDIGWEVKVSDLSPLDAVYDIHIKNLEPVAIFLGDDHYSISAEGNAFGYFRSMDNLLLLGGDIDISHFYLAVDDNKVLLEEVTGRYNVKNDYLVQGLAGFSYILNTSIKGVYTPSLSVNDLELLLDSSGEAMKLTASAVVDSVLTFALDGIIKVNNNSIETEISQLSLAYGQLAFTNSDFIFLRYNAAGLMVDSFSLKHNEESTISISGLIAREGDHNFEISIESVDVGDIHSVFTETEPFRRDQIFKGRMDLSGSLRGRTDDPKADITVSMTELEYGNVSFGNVNGLLMYDGGVLNIDLTMLEKRESENVAFLINGFLPFNPLGRYGNDRNRDELADSELFPNGAISIKVLSEGVEIALFDPFFGELRNLTGRFTSDLEISGTMEDPVYTGSLEIADGSLTFVYNNITYLFNTKIIPRRDEFLISQLQILNRRRDDPDGAVNMTGYIRMRGVAVDFFNVRADGQLMVMREDARRRAGQPFYGRLIVATGSEGLTLRGSPDESMLRGDVLIRSANLVIPPVATSVYEETGTLISYTFIDDREERYYEVSPVETFLRDVIASPRGAEDLVRKQSTFIDNLGYDITIKTDGRVELKMIFNRATGEELEAHLETSNLRLQSDDVVGMRLFGRVDIVPPSAHTFYQRKFDATGRLIFIGAPDNPELDITATYTGRRVPPEGHQAGGPDQPPTATRPQEVVVILKITGNRYEPSLELDLTVDGEEWMGDKETDAIVFILTGRFQGELNSADYNQMQADMGVGLPATFVSGFATSLLSGIFTDFLRSETRFIRDAEILWAGGAFSDAELRLSGEMRYFYWSVGGRVFDDINNTNISFQIPMGPVFNSERLAKLYLELERRVQGIEFNEDRQAVPVNTARLFYSIQF